MSVNTFDKNNGDLTPLSKLYQIKILLENYKRKSYKIVICKKILTSHQYI